MSNCKKQKVSIMSNCNEITPTFTWIIEGYSHGMAKYFNSREIRSPLFVTEHLGGTTWYLAIQEVSDKSDDGILCFLGRYSKDKGPDVVQLQWNLDVSQKLYNFKENEFFLSDKFERGNSVAACKVCKPHVESFSLHNISLLCSTSDLLPRENLHFKNSKGKTKIQSFKWSTKDLSTSKLCSGPNGLQYEVFLHDSNDNLSIRIRRSDKNTLKCYLMYGLSVNYEGAHSRRDPIESLWLNTNTHFSLLSRIHQRSVHSPSRPSPVGEPLGMTSIPIVREEIGWSKPFDIDDIIEIPVTFSKNGETFENGIISGCFVTSVIDVIPIVSIETQENINRVVPALKLDSIDFLKVDLLQMYENKKYSDVKLQIGDEVFPAHKCLLSSRSPVFDTKFNQDVVENQSGVVEITDMDGSTLNLLLKYMYTSVLEELNCEKALKLFLAAEKYQVYSLKEDISSYLMGHISDEDVCEILFVADMVADITLKTSAMNYVKEHAHNVLLSDSWNRLHTRNASLVAEIFSMLSKEFGAALSKNYGSK